ncbi:MAG: hypothetical protein QW228_07630 [Candidatus Aenigmatarchaeota archaeon]
MAIYQKLQKGISNILRKIKGFQSEEEERIFKETYEQELKRLKQEKERERIERIKQIAKERAKEKIFPQVKSQPIFNIDDTFLDDFLGIPKSQSISSKKKKKKQVIQDIDSEINKILFG